MEGRRDGENGGTEGRGWMEMEVGGREMIW
jgi:hypothetical protein